MREFINRFMAKNPTREEIKQFYEDYILPHDPEFSTVAEVQAEFAQIETETMLAAHQCPGNDATNCTKRGTHMGQVSS